MNFILEILFTLHICRKQSHSRVISQILILENLISQPLLTFSSSYPHLEVLFRLLISSLLRIFINWCHFGLPPNPTTSCWSWHMTITVISILLIDVVNFLVRITMQSTSYFSHQTKPWPCQSISTTSHHWLVNDDFMSITQGKRLPCRSHTTTIFFTPINTTIS